MSRSQQIKSPHPAAAGTGLLILGKVVLLAGDREVLERRQVPTAAANAADRLDLFNRAGTNGSRQIGGIDRPGFQVRRELQEQLIGFGVMLQVIGTRAVILLLQPQKRHLQPELFDLHLLVPKFEFGDPFLPQAKFTGALIQLVSSLLALARQIDDDCLQRFRVIRQGHDG
jgi:hypothetical protein